MSAVIRERVAQTSQDSLKRWLVASGRKYIIFNAEDLVDALNWPDGHRGFQHVVEAYRDYRRTKESNREERQRTLEGIEVPIKLMKDEVLEPDEKRELWEQLGKELGLVS